MRCTLLIFMFILSYVAYLGGLYITNIRTTFDFELERWEHVATVYPLDDDVDFAEFEKMILEGDDLYSGMVNPNAIRGTIASIASAFPRDS